MHELSLAGGILRLVEQTAERDPFERVRRLRLSVPALAGVEVRALRFALESIAPGTLIASATIDIDEPAGQAWCMSCCASVTLLQRVDPCPLCGGHRLQVTGGTEMKLVDLQVD
jgi:hydrogenase nickel incorporation protein HypA/HybF